MIHALRSLTTIETLFGYNISFGDKSNTNWTVDSVNWKGLWISQLKKNNNNYLLPECQFYPMHVYGKSFTLNNTLYLNDILYCITEVIDISKIRLNLIVCLFDKKIKALFWTC